VSDDVLRQRLKSDLIPHTEESFNDVDDGLHPSLSEWGESVLN
jgi:hypothetical protein